MIKIYVERQNLMIGEREGIELIYMQFFLLSSIWKVHFGQFSIENVDFVGPN